MQARVTLTRLSRNVMLLQLFFFSFTALRCHVVVVVGWRPAERARKSARSPLGNWRGLPNETPQDPFQIAHFRRSRFWRSFELYCVSRVVHGEWVLHETTKFRAYWESENGVNINYDE